MGATGDGVVIGAGLAGSLASLALAERGWRVRQLICRDTEINATGLSYGGVAGWSGPPGPLGERMGQAPRQWRRWQRRHGDLGWRPCRLRLEGAGAPWWERLRPRGFSRVDVPVLERALPGVLLAAGVERITVERLGPLELEPSPEADRRSGLTVVLPGGQRLVTDRLVLAAGAGCRRLWPDLPAVLRSSWAGVLACEQRPATVPGDQIRLPRHWQRPALERRARSLTAAEWIVDAGLAPWGAGLLLGQISLVRPEATPGPAPDPAWMEVHLRQALSGWGPPLGSQTTTYRQSAVAFSSDGLPLVGPLAERPELWLFTGFSGAFSQVPALAPVLADALSSSLNQALEQATAPLAALGVLPR